MFSQSLMYHAHRYSKNAWAGEPETDPTQDMDEPVEGWELTPQECLDLAYGGVQREKSVQCGSSTACIINMNASSGLLRAANLGDSGFTIIRSNTPFYVQPPQTHYFNCPKQLSKIPEFMKSDGSIVDHPSDADLYSINLQGGDIVIAYTDGLSDNLFPNDITAITSLVMRSNLDGFELAQTLADRLVLYATQCMWDKRRKSPFEQGCKAAGQFWRGGVSIVIICFCLLLFTDFYFSIESRRVSSSIIASSQSHADRLDSVTVLVALVYEDI
ncbi:hypothetical protein FRB91_006794 [Serendipita sp. 411]|nr:hypothetical protein FRB91_006794 [Serendipita sp. 411]